MKKWFIFILLTLNAFFIAYAYGLNSCTVLFVDPNLPPLKPKAAPAPKAAVVKLTKPADAKVDPKQSAKHNLVPTKEKTTAAPHAAVAHPKTAATAASHAGVAPAKTSTTAAPHTGVAHAKTTASATTHAGVSQAKKIDATQPKHQ